MPQPDQSRPVHVVQLTDAHLFADSAGSMLGLNTRDSLRHVVAQVRREQPLVDLLLCTGDLSQDASVASYEAFRELTAPFAVPTRWLPGNHDEARVMAQVAPELVQAVTDIGAWRIVMLNTAVPGRRMGCWRAISWQCWKRPCERRVNGIAWCASTISRWISAVPGLRRSACAMPRRCSISLRGTHRCGRCCGACAPGMG